MAGRSNLATIAMLKYIIIVFVVIAIAALAVQTISFYREEKNLKEQLSQLQGKASDLTQENGKLQKQIEYFSRPENLEKELKARFNYRNPDEKMMIIVP